MLLHLFPIPNPQSGCRRQCLGVVAKTKEALGVVMTLGFSKLFVTVLETGVFFSFSTLFFLFLFDLKKKRLGHFGEMVSNASKKNNRKNLGGSSQKYRDLDLGGNGVGKI